MLALGLLALAVLVVYLQRRYHHLCEEDNGRIWIEETSEPDWDWPPRQIKTASWVNKYERLP